MKQVVVILLVAALVTGCVERSEQKPQAFDESEAIAACEKIIGDFQAELKQELLAALAEGGPENAIDVCNLQAPLIAHRYSSMAGLNVRRVSLRQRNRSYSPDEFEVSTLEAFENAGTGEPGVMTALTKDSGEVKVFRYMKEIKTGTLCLKCHGDPTEFSEDLKKILAEKYPDDQAVGFMEGDSRGAFSVTLTYPEVRETIASFTSDKGY